MEGDQAAEDWRSIPGCPDYEISSLGRVKSWKTGRAKMLRPGRHPKTGYWLVSLRVAGRYFTRNVHRLVALAFLGDPAGRDVNHKNGDKRDNRLSNLEYLSRGDNHRHAYRAGLRPPVGRKLSPDDVRVIRKLCESQSRSSIARQFGVARTTIDNLYHGVTHQQIVGVA